jgi:hypothetical protein
MNQISTTTNEAITGRTISSVLNWKTGPNTRWESATRPYTKESQRDYLGRGVVGRRPCMDQPSPSSLINKHVRETLEYLDIERIQFSKLTIDKH